jgi:hypothetical protein
MFISFQFIGYCTLQLDEDKLRVFIHRQFSNNFNLVLKSNLKVVFYIPVNYFRY